jgi:uncharacterized phage protein gp47/JayE
MPFLRPSLPELRTRIEADIASRLGLGALLKRGVLKVLAAVQAGVSHMLHGHLDWNARQLMVDTAELEHLERWAAIWGVTRKSAAFAEGTVILDGSDGAIIPAGTLLQRADGVRYSVNAEVVIAAGMATASVTAVVAGVAGNEDPAVEITLVSPIAGVQTTAEIDAGGLVNGADSEPDEDLRGRVLARIQQAPQGGATSDYEAWALEVAGITRAWVRPEWTGIGSVGLLIVQDNDPGSIFPAPEKVEEVQDYVDERRPVTADVLVLAPTAKVLNLTITLTPNTADVRTAVEDSLRSLLKREAEPGGTLLLSRIREAISVAAGESNHVLGAPLFDVGSNPNELIVPGTVTWL